MADTQSDPLTSAREKLRRIAAWLQLVADGLTEPTREQARAALELAEGLDADHAALGAQRAMSRVLVRTLADHVLGAEGRHDGSVVVGFDGNGEPVTLPRAPVCDPACANGRCGMCRGAK